MTKNFIIQMFSELRINYAVYGNFHFKKIDRNDDIDIVIKCSDQTKVIKYLKLKGVNYEQRPFYPGQIFITGTDLKIHITNDIYIGGRVVQYLFNLKLGENIIDNSIKWDSLSIINYEYYYKYRTVKCFLNKRKIKKLSDHPYYLPDKKHNIFSFSLHTLYIVITTFYIAIFRFLKKRIWVKLLQS